MKHTKPTWEIFLTDSMELAIRSDSPIAKGIHSFRLVKGLKSKRDAMTAISKIKAFLKTL